MGAILAYVIDVAPADRISHRASAAVQVGAGLAIETALSLAKARGEPDVRSGALGIVREINDAVELRVGANASQSGSAPAEIGASASLGVLLSKLWNGRRATRITGSFGGSQSYRLPSAELSDPFGLDTKVYGYSAGIDFAQELTRGFEVGAGYARFGDTTGPDARDAVTFSMSARWATVTVSFTTTSLSFTGQARLQSSGLSLVYAHPAGWSVGGHGAVSESPELRPYASGGLDLGFAW